MQAPDKTRSHDPEAATLVAGNNPLHTSTPFNSSVDQAGVPQSAPTTTAKKTRVPKIATAVAFSIAAALGAHKCASSHNNREVAEYSVASSLGEVEKLAEVMIEGNPNLPEPKNGQQELSNYIIRNNIQLTAEDIEKAFAEAPTTATSNNSYIRVMMLKENYNDDGAKYF